VFAAIPASALIAVRIQHAGERTLGDAVTLFVLTLSAWVGVIGAVADLSTLDFCVRGNSAHEALCWYTPDYGSLWHPIVHFSGLSWKTAALAAYCALVFAYLAAPLVLALARAWRSSRPAKAWATGWRF